MKHVGIICEYNPLHTGHAYLLERVRGAQTVICLMSGNFTQRGEAAILPPVPRAAMAVAAGADLVLELPFPFAAASARRFAEGGVAALAALGVDTLAFGSESGDIAALQRAAVRTDASPAVRDAALPPEMGDAAAHFSTLGEALSSNDILAVEYARAARRYPMELLAVRRTGADYREERLTENHPSATALRAALARGEQICDRLPPAARALFADAAAQWGFADIARLAPAMLAQLRTKALPEGGIADCGGGLYAHLTRAAERATDYGSLLAAAATKRYTDGRLRRALLYLLAGVRTEDFAKGPAYLRLLAANARGRAFLAETRKTRTVGVVTKPADIVALGANAARQRELAQVADALYALCFAAQPLPHALQTAAPYFAKGD